MSDFAELCITTYKLAEEDAREWRRSRARQAFDVAFQMSGDAVEVSDDGYTVKVQGLVFAADHGEHSAVDFRLYHRCPRCESNNIYNVASRADVGRVLSLTGCSDCGG